MSERFRIGGVGRLAGAVILATVAGALAAIGPRLELGIAWIALVPAMVLVIPALGLARRIVLTRDGEVLVVEVGWLMRRAWRLPLRDLELELVPTAGLRAVVAHRLGKEYPLAVWIGRARAEALAAWLDAAAPGGRWPRRITAAPRGDR